MNRLQIFLTPVNEPADIFQGKIHRQPNLHTASSNSEIPFSGVSRWKFTMEKW
ncbi:unnamed protein product, partial [Nesidiocoris tenuis]